MTEMEIGSTTPSTPVVDSAPVSSQPAQQYDGTTAEERRFTQADIDRVAGRVRSETVERMKRETSIHAERNSQQQQQQPQQYAPQQATTSNQYTEDAIRKIANEQFESRRSAWLQEAQQKQQEEQAQRVAQDFLKKIDTGKTEFPDFDEKMKGLNYAEVPEIVEMATHLDNTAAVMYELGQNKYKIGNLLSLMQRSPQLAFAEMQRLSESIKLNKNSQYEPQTKSPLSQIKASNQGMDRSGVLSVADYRKKFKG